MDESIALRIVEYADLSPEDHVLEIGPGTGNLTAALAAKADEVYDVYEINLTAEPETA